MSHEPGRERFMTYRCECCGLGGETLKHVEQYDEYWCDGCISNLVAIRERENENPPRSNS
jgi:hypothetical protein